MAKMDSILKTNIDAEMKTTKSFHLFCKNKSHTFYCQNVYLVKIYKSSTLRESTELQGGLFSDFFFIHAVARKLVYAGITYDAVLPRRLY